MSTVGAVEDTVYERRHFCFWKDCVAGPAGDRFLLFSMLPGRVTMVVSNGKH